MDVKGFLRVDYSKSKRHQFLEKMSSAALSIE
jgi:hypothetical protein